MAQQDADEDGSRWAADDALSEMYAAHWHSLVRLSWLLVHNQHIAEETVQDAFISMHSRWGRLREPELALAYLRRCVVNASRSVLRHRNVERRHVASELEYSPDVRRHEPSAEQHALDHFSGETLIQALAGLSSRQREVLTLRYYLDLSEAQIADALGISAGSVKAHAHRGLTTLRATMEETS